MSEYFPLATLGGGTRWQAVWRDLAVFFIAIFIAYLTHYFVYALVRRFAKQRGSFIADAIVTHTFRAARLLLLLLAI